jgi:hypothetical protein
VFESTTRITEDVWATSGPTNNEHFTQNPDLIIHGVVPGIPQSYMR